MHVTSKRARVVATLAVVVGLAAAVPPAVKAQCKQPVTVPNSSWIGQDGEGPPQLERFSHQEREFKFGFRGRGVGAFTTRQLAAIIHDSLDTARQRNDWQAARL